MTKRVKANCRDCGRYIDTGAISEHIDAQNEYRRSVYLSPTIEFRTLICRACFKKRQEAVEKSKKTTCECGRCSGTGRIKGYKCQACNGKGKFQKDDSFLQGLHLTSSTVVAVCPNW